MPLKGCRKFWQDFWKDEVELLRCWRKWVVDHHDLLLRVVWAVQWVVFPAWLLGSLADHRATWILTWGVALEVAGLYKTLQGLVTTAKRFRVSITESTDSLSQAASATMQLVTANTDVTARQNIRRLTQLTLDRLAREKQKLVEQSEGQLERLGDNLKELESKIKKLQEAQTDEHDELVLEILHIRNALNAAKSKNDKANEQVSELLKSQVAEDVPGDITWLILLLGGLLLTNYNEQAAQLIESFYWFLSKSVA